VFAVPRIYELRTMLQDGGLTGLLEDLKRHPCTPDEWISRFDFVFYRTALDAILVENPELAAFQGSYHTRQVQEFRELDRRHLSVSAERIKRFHGEKAVAAMNENPVQRDLVKREANKRSRHISLRRLLAGAPDVLTRVAPCWVASPLSVSQLLDGGSKHFDVVVFDEASQILPEDAVTAIMRGEQVVVAGDQHQLPPTTFFAGIADDDEDDDDLEAISGFESLLDNLSSFLPPWLLEWHYRSQDERLIAFSNAQIYDGRLITFPGTLGDGVVSNIEIPFDRGMVLQEESSSPEVERVVELVLEHAEENVELDEEDQKSLGVITMGIKHANRVQAAIDRALDDRPDLYEFFSTEKAERFFVKNLETVQGDERDAIILSIGYGKTAEGDLPHRFGPLTQEVGYRRLNVAVTRAKSRMTVVSSFSHRDVDLNRSGSRGVRLLKSYLEFAETGGREMQLQTGGTGVPLNAFEADIKNALELQGIHIIPQYGASRYRIDLVATDPNDATKPILAIECDGASYHSSATARERDRLRQEHLMRLKWRFHRIWSTDWFNHREDEIRRAVEAYQDATTISTPSLYPDSITETSETTESDNGRGPAPYLQRRESITEYTVFELTKLAQWAMSDERLRTDDELSKDMFEHLPFTRRASRIRERLQAAIDRARNLNREAS
jgi:very-short-patch-repair endonuclease